MPHAYLFLVWEFEVGVCLLCYNSTSRVIHNKGIIECVEVVPAKKGRQVYVLSGYPDIRMEGSLWGSDKRPLNLLIERRQMLLPSFSVDEHIIDHSVINLSEPT